MITKRIDIRLSLYLILGFILFTAIGTVSHELGHYAASELLGYHARINYAYTVHDQTLSLQHAFIITLCGPLQTIITGTIGFIFLLLYRNDFKNSIRLSFKQWIIIFVSLFWLRELFNFVHALIIYFIKGYFPDSNDEARLASVLDINELSVILPLAIIASCILAFVIFKIIPLQQRFTFIISGLAGGMLGFYFWLHLIGPIVMP